MHILSHENSVRFCGQKRGVCCCDFAAAAKLHFFRCLDTKNARKITESKSSDFAEPCLFSREISTVEPDFWQLKLNSFLEYDTVFRYILC